MSRESLTTPTTHMQRRSPRHQTASDFLSLPESPRGVTIEINQNEKRRGRRN